MKRLAIACLAALWLGPLAGCGEEGGEPQAVPPAPTLEEDYASPEAGRPPLDERGAPAGDLPAVEEEPAQDVPQKLEE